MAKYNVRNIWDVVKPRENSISYTDEQQKDSSSSVETTLASGDLEGVQSLFHDGIPINSQDEESDNGHFPLHSAVMKSQVDTVKVLVEQGAEVNERSSAGQTPLHLACSTGCTDIVKYLLENGADADINDNEGRTAADLTTSDEVRRMLQATSSPVPLERQSPVHVPSKGAFDISFRKYCSRVGLGLEDTEKVDRLYLLYCAVKRQGGYRKVSKLNRWSLVLQSLDNGFYHTEDERTLQTQYSEYLCEYEEHVSRMTAQWMNGHTEDNKSPCKTGNEVKNNESRESSRPTSQMLNNGPKQSVGTPNRSLQERSLFDKFTLESKKTPDKASENGTTPIGSNRRSPSLSPGGKTTHSNYNNNVNSAVNWGNWNGGKKVESTSQVQESLWERIQSRHEKIVSTSGPFTTPVRVRPPSSHGDTSPVSLNGLGSNENETRQVRAQDEVESVVSSSTTILNPQNTNAEMREPVRHYRNVFETKLLKKNHQITSIDC